MGHSSVLAGFSEEEGSIKNVVVMRVTLKSIGVQDVVYRMAKAKIQIPGTSSRHRNA